MKVEGYLARKYGLTGAFPATHPWKNSALNPHDQEITQGGEKATVTFYWGDNNGSDVAANWDNNQTVAGPHGLGLVSLDLTGLTKGATYYYGAKVSNSGGEVWMPVETFVPAKRILTKDSLPGLVLWLDASDVNGDGVDDALPNGAALSSWDDKSNSDKQVFGASNPVYKTNQFSGKGAVRLSGTGDHFFVNGSLRATPGAVSAYVVSKRDVEGGDVGAYLLDEVGWSLSAGEGNATYSTQTSKYSASSGQTLANL